MLLKKQESKKTKKQFNTPVCFFVFLFFCFFAFAGCRAVDQLTGLAAIEQKKQADKTLATIKCQELCQNKISLSNGDFSSGPCLSNGIIPDWVCDIAHSPRQPIDDDPANQCSAFREGQAHHFVEVDGNCNVIKIY